MNQFLIMLCKKEFIILHEQALSDKHMKELKNKILCLKQEHTQHTHVCMAL